MSDEQRPEQGVVADAMTTGTCLCERTDVHPTADCKAYDDRLEVEVLAARGVQKHRCWISDGGPGQTYWTCECGWACSDERWEQDLGVGHVPAAHITDELKAAGVLRDCLDEG